MGPNTSAKLAAIVVTASLWVALDTGGRQRNSKRRATRAGVPRVDNYNRINGSQAF